VKTRLYQGLSVLRREMAKEALGPTDSMSDLARRKERAAQA